ncbi:zinc-dependent metalloprotease [Terrimonas sp. NA20]|uniref:Zinc-dependent metalloprotease n=1 Tax=Terrimonas ginsenosidimutans TaxID=2908004 RepID=A0ABS9KTR9_9BACT|nr:M57 family metalloprotease [Terrimonas ginsenosidimutans]MCG2615732.1 zinc-dependent metalloprotease [Terrimonas ginsenosidimutans]
MKKLIAPVGFGLLLTLAFFSCKKSANDSADTSYQQLSDDERALIVAAGFNGNWAERTSDGNYLVEGDILLSRAQLNELKGVVSHEIIYANEEHYRTTNVVSTPASGQRTITVRLGSGFPAHYSTGLDQALARYNNLNLKIRFQRVSSGGNIVITGANLGTSGGGCILGQAAGFPTSSGNPSSGFVLSTSSCATSYLNTANKADEVIAHEIGHCIGFRHTDYMNRSSCGQNVNEGSAGVGAVHIPNTPTTVTGSYNSWMMACTNGSPSFSAADNTALNYVY